MIFCRDRNDYNPGSDAYDELLANGYEEMAIEHPETTPDDWDSTTAYAAGDFVTYRTRTWKAVAANTNKPPVMSNNNIDTTNWQPLVVYIANNNRMADMKDPILRDLFFPTAAKTDANITAVNCDNHWTNSVPAVGSADKNFKMVAIGDNRNYGAGLGAFSLDAYNVLGVSIGDFWRGRACLQLV